MNGGLINTHDLALDGKELQIEGSSLRPGMYIYTLICDNKEIDSKRMILTN
jgi:glycogen debranching enzyme